MSKTTLALIVLIKTIILSNIYAETQLINTSMLNELDTTSNKQNVVFILIDDLGWKDLQCYGSDFYETPHIDAFAKTAMRFTDAYTASPLCSPTRASILTGLEPGRIRLTIPNCHHPKVSMSPKERATAAPQHKATVPESCTRLDNNYLSIAEVFKHWNYNTAFMGKWHLGRAPYIPDNQGFDLVIGGREHPGPPGGFFSPWSCNTLPVRPSGTHICDALTDEAISYISEQKDSAFMLCLWYYDVHAPFQAKKELIAKYDKKLKPHHIQRSSIMAAMIETMDANVGRLLRHLSDLGLDENTIVVLTSDNGGNMYNCPNGQLATNNYPLRGGKGNNYEGGVRVPLIIRAPGVTKANTVSHQVTSTVDHYSSLMELVGQPVPENYKTDGQSYVHALKGEEEKRQAIYSAFFHRTPRAANLPNVSMREGDWRLYRFPFDGENMAHRYELYNLKEDIGETNNLAYVNTEIRDAMVAKLDSHIVEAGYLQSKLNKRFKGSAAGPFWASDSATLAVTENVLQLNANNKESYVETDMVPGFDGKAFVLSFSIKANSGNMAHVAWHKKNGKETHTETQEFSIIADNHWHQYEVVIEDNKVNGIRISPSNTEGTSYIKNIQMKTTDKHLVRTWPLNFSSIK